MSYATKKTARKTTAKKATAKKTTTGRKRGRHAKLK